MFPSARVVTGQGEYMKYDRRHRLPFALTPLAIAIGMGLDFSIAPGLASATQSSIAAGLGLTLQSEGGRESGTRKALIFEPNLGQADATFRFIARTPGLGFGFAVANDSLVFDLGKAKSASQRTIVQAHFLGASDSSSVSGAGRLGSYSNYALGADPGKWKNGVPNFSRVRIESLYPGIDLVVYGRSSGELEYDVILQPGAAPRTVRMAFQNAEWLELDTDGALKIHTEAGVMRLAAPHAYQTIDDQMVQVDSHFVLEGPDVVAFSAGFYNTDQALLIDPVLSYSSYLGGSGDDWVQGIATDPAGGFYAVGGTNSSNFIGASGATSLVDAYLIKFDAAGRLQYTSFFGGSAYDAASSVVLGPSGVYVAGNTCSTNIPTPNGYQRQSGGGCDSFLARFTPSTGALEMATYLGGSGDDGGGFSGSWPDPELERARPALAINASGDIVMVGTTNSTNFPTAGMQLPSNAGSHYSGFVARFAPSGALLMSSRIGGSGGDEAINSVVTDAAGNLYLGGVNHTAAGYDGFVHRVGASGADAFFPLGSSGVSEVTSVALGPSGGIWAGGNTNSAAFPVTQGPGLVGGTDMFVALVGFAGLPTLVSSTLIGGSNADALYSIRSSDDRLTVYGVGRTSSSNIPFVSPLQARSGSSDAYVFRYKQVGGLTFGSPLGGADDDVGNSIALDQRGRLYVGGYTHSSNFPVRSPAQQTFQGGYTDGFVSRITFNNIVPILMLLLD